MTRRKAMALMLGSAGLRGADYQGLLRSGVEQRCIENDIDLWVYSGHHDWRVLGAQAFVYDFITPEHVDGIVIAAGCIATFRDVHQLLSMLRDRCPVPTCIVGYQVPGLPSIVIENGPGMMRVVDHLARVHGRRTFAFVSGPVGHEESNERLAAARRALAEFGIELPPAAVFDGDFSRQSGAAATRQCLERMPFVDAIVAANDDMAAGVLDVLTESGWRCPEDVSVVGFDDAPSARICTPALTTVRQPILLLGRQGADFVIDAWRGTSIPILTSLSTETVWRESCGCDPLFGPEKGLTDAPERRDRDPHRQRTRLAALLSGFVGDKRQQQVWAAELLESVSAEARGRHGSVRSVVHRLLEQATPADAQVHDLQRVIDYLRTISVDSPWPEAQTVCVGSPLPEARTAPLEEATRTNLSEAFCDCMAAVGENMHRREISRRLNEFFLMDELRNSWERVATSPSMDALREALLADLPRFSVNNAIVSVFPSANLDALLPLAHLADGIAVPFEPVPYPSSQLIPAGVTLPSVRWSLTILPLTFELEALGVAILELPLQEAYMVLREQIGAAIKTVRLRETLLAQQEALKLRAQAEKQASAERLRAMSVIAGGVAHDLNNVLGPLIALPDTIRADLLANRGNMDDFLSDLSTLQEAAQRAAHTIRDLLTLGRAIIPKRTLELNELLSSAQRTLVQLTERTDHVRLKLDLNCEPLLVQVSREHMIRAVSNLVVNACEAMAQPGEIVVRTRERSLEARLEGIEPVEPGHYAVIEVQDAGQGIPEQDLPRVLEPFYTSKVQSARSGTGLGLAIVHQVVGHSNGYVHVTSKVGVGTTFAIYLPIVAQRTAATTAPPAPTRGGSERILVVDDERVQLRTAERILRQHGYRVSTANTAEEALELFDESALCDPFDLVILDMLMPGSQNGLVTLRHLRERKPLQKALLVSGYAPEQMGREAAEHCVRWLPKPYDNAGLAGAVRAALETAVLAR